MRLKNLAKLRRSRGLTQAEVADLLGVAPAAVSAWEVGKNRPTDDHLHALCTAFRVTAEYLMGLRGASQASKQTPLRRVA